MIAWGAARYIARRRTELGAGFEEAVSRSERRGLLFASGLITGEALVGIMLAIPFAAAQSTDVLNLAPAGFEPVATALGIGAFAMFCLWLYNVARKTTA